VSLHFDPQTKATKLCSEFCPEEEGISAGNGLFHNALSRSKVAVMGRLVVAPAPDLGFNSSGNFATLAAIRRKREAPAGGSLDRGLA
jgi:hypothetical protein